MLASYLAVLNGVCCSYIFCLFNFLLLLLKDFEEALFLDSAENVSSFLPDLVIRLLRGLYRTKDGLQVT